MNAESEKQTRQARIDAQLRRADWRVDDPAQVSQEVGVGARAADLETRYAPQVADYVLRDPRGRPLAVVEAKRTSRDAEAGREQARQYAERLRDEHGGAVPFCFYTNGHELFFWDLGHYPRTEALLRDKKDQTEWQCARTWKLFPSDAVQDVAEKARLMKTTLWFDGTDATGQRDGIIATGQFTMCYNLLLYLGKVERRLPGQFTPALLDLRNRMLADWNKFQENPTWMMDADGR